VSATAKARQLAFEAAERRVLARLEPAAEPRSAARRAAVIAGAAVLFVVIFLARLMVDDPDALIANFYIVPIALLAIEFGARAGILAAALALGLVVLWSALETVHVGALGYASRGAALLVTGAVVGKFSERLRHDVLERRLAQQQLALYADQLEHANHDLALTVERLEAFAAIARAVGGETDPDRVLSLVLAKGREIVAASELVISSEDAAAGGTEALVVPIVFRGDSLGELVALGRDDGRPFGEEDRQLLLSVAASAATALATARSVASERLRVSLEAAEEARARWARELHDQTLQGLTGVRMVLAAGLARGDLGALRSAAETADAHLGAEVRALRELITELRPAALDDLGLGPALESLAQRQAAAGGFSVEVSVSPGPGGWPRELEGAIYRIVQEALSNVVKHAEAERVALLVGQREASAEVLIDDDGRGFDPAGVSAGFGLTGMRERAMLLGGELSVSSAAGGPTRVRAVLPV
jgi:signal transduction histidine kinase